MPMNVFTDAPNNGLITLAIHTDTTKVTEDGKPDENYVEWFQFAQPDMSQKPAGVTDNKYRNDYINTCTKEAKLLVRAARRAQRKALAEMGTPVADNS